MDATFNTPIVGATTAGLDLTQCYIDREHKTIEIIFAHVDASGVVVDLLPRIVRRIGPDGYDAAISTIAVSNPSAKVAAMLKAAGDPDFANTTVDISTPSNPPLP